MEGSAPRASQESAALLPASGRLARYIVGADASETLALRYREASCALFPDPPDEIDRALLGFVDRHPWSLPYLDAGTGLLRPRSLLRKKVLLMLAILESAPEFAAAFEAPPTTAPGAVLRLAGYGLSSACRSAAGIALYAFVVGLRR